MAKKGRVQVKLRSTESAYMYTTTKNAKKHPERMELRKYDPMLRRHAQFKEEK
ncbi:MAG: 50S ribosomal protein L33 [Gemmatimonadales bacterium]